MTAFLETCSDLVDAFSPAAFVTALIAIVNLQRRVADLERQIRRKSS